MEELYLWDNLKYKDFISLDGRASILGRPGPKIEGVHLKQVSRAVCLERDQNDDHKRVDLHTGQFVQPAEEHGQQYP